MAAFVPIRNQEEAFWTNAKLDLLPWKKYQIKYQPAFNPCTAGEENKNITPYVMCVDEILCVKKVVPTVKTSQLF